MYLYALQLFDLNYKDDIILAMTSSGIRDATVLEGTNLDDTVRTGYPVFSEVLSGGSGKKRASLLIFGMVDSRETMIACIDILKQAGITNTGKEIYRLMIAAGENLV